MDADFTSVMLSMSLHRPVLVAMLMRGHSVRGFAEVLREMRPRDKRCRGGNDVESFGVPGNCGTL